MNQKSKPKHVLTGKALIGALKKEKPIDFQREPDRNVGQIINAADHFRDQIKSTMTANEIRNAIDDGRD